MEMQLVIFSFVALVVVSASDLSSDCDRRYTQCQKYMAWRGAEDRCSEGLELCNRCPSEECDEQQAECIKKAKENEDMTAVGEAFGRCIEGWYTCSKAKCPVPAPNCDCKCRFQRCQKHMSTMKKEDRCTEGLELCAKCDTVVCDAEQDVCIKNAKKHEDFNIVHEEFQKCINSWYACAQGKCGSGEL